MRGSAAYAAVGEIGAEPERAWARERRRELGMEAHRVARNLASPPRLPASSSVIVAACGPESRVEWARKPGAWVAGAGSAIIVAGTAFAGTDLSVPSARRRPW